MLLKGIAALSLVFSLVSAAVMHVFYGFPLWLAPLLYAADCLILFLLAFLFLCIVCALVDLNKPQEEDSRFYRAVMHLYIEALITLVRLKVEVSGLEKTPREGRFLLVCNHQNEADPGILLHYFKKSQLAFISKRENANMFAVGKFMHKILCQLVNRENDREALKTILKCIQLIKEDKVSIGAFPEGGHQGKEQAEPFPQRHVQDRPEGKRAHCGVHPEGNLGAVSQSEAAEAHLCAAASGGCDPGRRGKGSQHRGAGRSDLSDDACGPGPGI